MKLDLTRYATEAWGRADELLDLLSHEEREELEIWMEENIDFMDIISPPSDRVLTILSQTPSRDEKWLQTKDREKFLREWLQARHWAMTSAIALQSASSVLDAMHKGYRATCRSVAQAAGALPDRVDPDDWLWRTMES